MKTATLTEQGVAFRGVSDMPCRHRRATGRARSDRLEQSHQGEVQSKEGLSLPVLLELCGS